MLNIALALLLLFDLATAFRAHHVAHEHPAGLERRQGSTTTCPTVSPGPSLCARACGPGYIICPGGSGGFVWCFNPSVGETCCQDGGMYC